MEFEWLVFTSLGTINVGKNNTSIIRMVSMKPVRLRTSGNFQQVSKKINFIMAIFVNVQTASVKDNTKVELRSNINKMNG